MITNWQIRFYLQTGYVLPVTLNSLGAFLFKASSLPVLPMGQAKFFPWTYRGNLIETMNRAKVYGYGELRYAVIDFYALTQRKFYAKTYFYLAKNRAIQVRRALTGLPAELLAMDFSSMKNYTYKTPPRQIGTNKILEISQRDAMAAVLEIEAFPYDAGRRFLGLADYDFYKHSLILGASGSGKSKFLGGIIEELYRNENLRRNYKVVVIDPHAALKEDVGALGKVMDFLGPESSIDLFASVGDNANASTELLLDLFKTLLSDQWNPKLERVLRHAVYLLLIGEMLNFPNLRKLLTDLEYRNNLVREFTSSLPFSVVDFFLTDFNELRTKSYSEAISPIIGFLDEMEMVPAFSRTEFRNNLAGEIRENFLTLFSLDRVKLGTKITRTIAGLIMEQILTLVESEKWVEKIILVVDEVAVIENPILGRLLSEARKYGLSLILVGQFFNQFSEGLKNSILANVVNFYLFRLSRMEAEILAKNLEIPVGGVKKDELKEARLKLLTELNNRECIVRISAQEKLLSAFRARTMDFRGAEGGASEQ